MHSSLLLQILPWAAMVVAVLAAAFMQYLSSAFKARTVQAELKLIDLEHQFVHLTDQLQAQDRKIERLTWETQRLREDRQVESIPTPAPSVVSDAGGNYQHAIRLASRGESAQSLMEICAISRGEADLLIKLHSKSAIPA